MKVLFIGGTRRGYLTLRAMLDHGIPVAGIVSLAQDPHELEQWGDQIAALATERLIPLREARRIRGSGWIDWSRGLNAEAAVAVGVRTLLPTPFVSAFGRGCWAVHDSLLPSYRGFSPTTWAIINDEKYTGVTLFRLTPETDAGDILLQQTLSIGLSETGPELYQRVCAATIEVVLEGYARLSKGEPEVRQQPHELATFACARTPDDGEINWSASSRTVFNLIRALTFPYPGAFTYLGGERLYVTAAEELTHPLPHVGRIPGRVVRFESGGGVEVLTGDGMLRILEVSTDGSTTQKAGDVIRSVRERLGLNGPELERLVGDLRARLSALEDRSGS
ncbi:MAG: methionyl-tRNA formyltransferase [Dehalococcoidia bacterium]|nr:methionyl-tRNA formyltransferase [Dehalococcoidia bacterium]